MNPPTNPSAALQARIDEIGMRMDKGFDELKALLGNSEQRIRQIEQDQAGQHPLLESRIDAAWRKLDDHSLELKSVNTRADKALLIAERLEMIFRWLLGIITATIVAILIALISGKLVITFR